jgi:hypothetical protein
MDYQFRIRQLAHEFAGTPCVVEMDVRQKQVIHISRAQVFRLQYLQHGGDRR